MDQEAADRLPDPLESGRWPVRLGRERRERVARRLLLDLGLVALSVAVLAFSGFGVRLLCRCAGLGFPDLCLGLVLGFAVLGCLVLGFAVFGFVGGLGF
ncbi:hypothetical protein ACFQ1L_04315 [Phytohabitans flavus]|uniref:hypothetical protein n=1 Tax=Phytohabitans flavus TaxID=1076124 RepID=UPI0036321537